MFQPTCACSKSHGKDYKQDLLISTLKTALMKLPFKYTSKLI